MTYFIAPISHGIGDLVVSLPAVQFLINSSKPTYLVTRSQAQNELAQRIAGLQGVIPEDEFVNSPLNIGDSYINLREHPLQKNFWWGSALCDRYFPGLTINDLLSIICQDFDLQADFAQPQALKFEFVPEMKDKIIFVPGSDGLFKCWTKEYWLSLANVLVNNGFSISMLGQPESSVAVKELVPYINWLATPKLTDALDVISSAAAVISVDTGFMHMAVQQRIPTIGLYRSYPIYHRSYAHTFALTARACDARCLNEAQKHTSNKLTNLSGFQYTSWQCQADEGQSCMSSIRVQSVLDIMKANGDIFLPNKAAYSLEV